MNRTLCSLGLLLAALSLGLSACNTGTKAGATNVELASPKKGPAAEKNGVSNGDSLAAGIARDTVHRPTGKDLYKAAGQAADHNHDGIAD